MIQYTQKGQRLGESKIKLLLTRLAYLIIHYFSDINLPIEAGDYKLISRRAMDNILKQKNFVLISGVYLFGWDINNLFQNM